MSVLNLRRAPVPPPAPSTLAQPEEPLLLAGPIEPLVLLDAAELVELEDLVQFELRQALIEQLIDAAQPWLTFAQLLIAGGGFLAAAWAWWPIWMGWLW